MVQLNSSDQLDEIFANHGFYKYRALVWAPLSEIKLHSDNDFYDSENYKYYVVYSLIWTFAAEKGAYVSRNFERRAPCRDWLLFSTTKNFSSYQC